MKRLTLLTIVFTLFPFLSLAQLPATLMTDSAANFYQIDTVLEKYFAQFTDTFGEGEGESEELMIEEGGEHMEYLRWKRFWKHHIYNDDTISGSFEALLNVTDLYMDDPEDYCTNNVNFESEWKYIGPKNSKSDQNMGRVDAVWLDPNNHNHILAGGNSGGLWESHFNSATGEMEWECITDSRRLPGLGFTSIVADYSGSNETIYAATGFNSQGIRGYGIGIIYTTDGGDNWSIDSDFRNTIEQYQGNSQTVKFPWVGDLKQIPNSNDLIATSRNLILRRENGSWEIVYEFEGCGDEKKKINFNDIEFLPGSGGNTIIVGGTDVNAEGCGVPLMRSDDGGDKQTWYEIPVDYTTTLCSGDFENGSINQLACSPGSSWTDEGDGSGNSEWHRTTVGGDHKATIYPDGSQGNDQRLIKDINFIVAETGEYKVTFDYEIPQGCTLKVMLMNIDDCENSEITVASEYEITQSQVLTGSGTANIAFRHFDQFIKYGYISFESSYNGSGTSPDPIYVDNVELVSVSHDIIKVELPSSDKMALFVRNPGRKVAIMQHEFSSGNWTTDITNLGGKTLASKSEFEVNTNDHEVMYVGGTALYKWNPSSASFDPINCCYSGNSNCTGGPTNCHVDVRSMYLKSGSVSGGSEDVLLIGNDGGVSYSDDGGSSFENKNGLNKPLAITQFFGFANDEQDDEYIIGGSQDNRTLRRTANGWEEVGLGGDGYSTAVEKENNNFVYASNNVGNSENPTRIYRSDDRWNSNYSPITRPSGIEPAPKVKPISTHEQSRKRLYVGYNALYYSDDRGSDAQTWTISNNGVPFGKDHVLPAFKVAPYNEEVKYIAYHRWAPDKVIFRYDPNELEYDDVTQSFDNGYPDPGTSGALVTDITCDPDDPDRVWITMSGISCWDEETCENVKNRVYYSDDGGINWTDVSQGLSPFPVYAIEYQENSNDIIYVGSDIGVYIWNKDTEQWECFSKNLPPTVISDLEINYCSGTLRASTFGRGIWETPLPDPEENAIHLNDNMTWDEHRNFANDVVVDEATTLTIEGGNDYNFAPGTKIIVERGGFLNIEPDAILSNRCNNSWEGIQVFGHPENYSLGGMLTVDGATIANARVGIRNCKVEDWGPELSYSGGRITVDDALFENCWKSIEMWTYPEDVNYKVKNSEFLLTEDFFEVWGEDKAFHAFVTTWDVPIKFENNDFDNQAYSVFDANQDGQRGKGIYAENADIVISGDCGSWDQNTGDCLSYDGSTFKNLHTGVEVVGIGGLKGQATIATGNKFLNNHWGIRLANTRNDHVSSNYFEVPVLPSSLNDITYATGIVMEHAQGFKVYNNEIIGPDGAQEEDWSIGVRVSNSGFTGGEVNYNEIDDTKYGFQAEGRNPRLQLGCNIFKDHEIALSINPQSPWPVILPPYPSFADQEASCDGMWNEFHISCDGSAPTHIFSNVDFTYYENSNNPYPVDANCVTFIPGGGHVDNNCNTSHDCSYPHEIYAIPRYHGNISDLRNDIDAGPEQPEIQFLRNELLFAYSYSDTSKSLIYGLLDEMNHKDATRTLAMTALDNGDMAYADSIMDTMSLDTRGDTMFADIESMVSNTLEGDEEGGGNLREVDSTDVQTLSTYTQDTLSEAAYARSIHQIAGDTAIKKEEEVWASEKRSRFRKEEEVSLNSNLGDNIPNPFEQTTVIPFEIEDDKEAILIITNSMGQTIKTIRLNPDKGRLTLSTESWPAGLYYYSLELGGQVIESKSMTIVK